MSKEIDTWIDGVTVFRDGARIIRIARPKISAGEQTLTIGGITNYAQEDSFRVKGKGAASIKGIDVKRVTKTYEPEGNLKEMLEELKGFEKKQAIVSSKIENQESRVTQFETVMTQFSTEFGKWFAAGESTMERLDEMDKVGLKQITDAKKKLRALEEERKELDAKIQALQNNINRVQGERKTETTYEVQVMLNTKEASQIELEVVYQIAYAGWSPTYDVDLQLNKSSLKRIAMIYNNSLENWNNVDLVVSTASARPVRAVEASPYYVDVFSPYIGGMVSATSSGMVDGLYSKEEKEEGADFDDETDYFAEPAPSIVETYAEASETLSGVVVYDVPGKVSITSGDDPHPVTLQLEEFESRQLHFWNAYAMPEVVAQDEITNGDSVLLPGGVKVYSEGDFIGETSIGMISPREKFRLGTRTAYDVKAEKKLVSKDTDKAGITRGKTKRGYQYQIKIESFSKENVEIRIVDRIPHSSSEQIVVELKEPSHIPKKNELGVIEWELKVEPQGKISINYEYEVEWEKDIRINPPLP
ncbi:MAG: mucoidy inhibitor MuiA family protein [Candidatus Thorarchaeota archaeon]|nr:mucoidy inhibitor MuiA family protein [Candidatus Thorarchaeota archaeon]